MKTLLLALGVFCLSGCSLLERHHHEALAPLPKADRVSIKSRAGATAAVTEITDPAQVARLVEFVNALPAKWSVPWYGPPVGQVYFTFHRGEARLGNFYVGPNFFGRAAGNFWSQPASEKQIREVGRIAGFDLWETVHP